ncbi:MAG: PQQ-binding-like beta-propeller repeat protein [Proteobacteria bacterium]|nr:PQQ-binding-like beta-propeller repeat protein [Pseudomonadota bacterium]
MPYKFYKLVILGAALLGMSGCGLFGKEPLNIDGERINVIREDTSLAPDYAPGEIKLRLPRPYSNARWSQNGGNAQHLMGHLEADAKLKELWDSSFGSGTSKRDILIASPVISNQVVFTIDAEAVVSAFRLDNGKRIWKKRLKPTNKEEKSSSLKGAGIAVYNQKVYATTGFGDVFCLNMFDGKKLWKTSLEMPIRIAPTVAANRVIVQALDNTLAVLDAQDGKTLWKGQTDYEATTIVGGASPAYNTDMDVIIAAFSNGELRAFKASTGTPLWTDLLVSKKRTNSLAEITAIKANPVIDGDKVFAVGYNSVLAAIDLRTGSRIWEREMGSTSQPWVAGEYIFVLTNDFNLLALNKNNGKIIWNTAIPTGEDLNEKSGVFGNGPVLASNRLIVATSNGYIFAVSPYNGEIISYISASDDIALSPVVADGVAVFTTSDADITAYK